MLENFVFKKMFSLFFYFLFNFQYSDIYLIKSIQVKVQISEAPHKEQIRSFFLVRAKPKTASNCLNKFVQMDRRIVTKMEDLESKLHETMKNRKLWRAVFTYNLKVHGT